jgi:5-methylcytosine-specific restriction endonuclease McrA
MASARTKRRAAKLRLNKLVEKFKADGKGPRCVYCGTIAFTDSNFLTVDHIIPLHLGGSSGYDNIVPCCWECNSSKGSQVWDIVYQMTT